MKTLTPEQFEALRDYAKQNGRNWKSQLRDDWITGKAYGELQQIRNQFGPSWLTRFKLKQPS